MRFVVMYVDAPGANRYGKAIRARVHALIKDRWYLPGVRKSEEKETDGFQTTL